MLRNQFEVAWLIYVEFSFPRHTRNKIYIIAFSLGYCFIVCRCHGIRTSKCNILPYLIFITYFFSLIFFFLILLILPRNYKPQEASLKSNFLTFIRKYLLGYAISFNILLVCLTNQVKFRFDPNEANRGLHRRILFTIFSLSA